MDYSDASWQPFDKKEPDFERVASDLLSSALSVCEYLLPGGKKTGNEYVCADLSGGKGRSLSVNLTKGVWEDFSTGVSGGDLINLWSAVNNLRPIEARREAASWLGIAPMGVPRAKPSGAGPNPPGKARQRDFPPKSASAGQKPATPDPKIGVFDDKDWWRGRKADKVWDYTDADGNIVAQVCRWEHQETGEKVVRPWDPETQKYGIPSGRRPLYGLRGILRSTSTVYLVEGEKCADVLIGDGLVATTVMGGAQALSKTDMDPLQGRDVVLWPDNDIAGKEWMKKALEVLKEAEAASARVVSIPEGKPAKWDCADATKEERVKLIHAVLDSRPVISGRPKLTITDWTADSDKFAGPAPKREWLINDVFPLGVAVLLAAMGDTGKGMLTLDLAIKVATGTSGVSAARQDTAFGCTVTAHGTAVIFTAEDDQAEMHRRLEKLAPDGLRKQDGHRLFILPMPNIGGAFPMMRSTPQGCEMTEEFGRVRDQLLALDELRLIVIDPLSAFIHADINKDAAACSFFCQQMAMLASECRATVILAHHMRKPSGDRTVSGPVAARDAIRGVTNMVDGVRCAYALWPAEDNVARNVCRKLGREYSRGLVVSGAVVKSNAPGDRTVRVYVRNEKTGLLIDKTPQVGDIVNPRYEDIEGAVVHLVMIGAGQGKPYCTTGDRGLAGARMTDIERIIDRSTTAEEVKKVIDRLKLNQTILLSPARSGSARGALDVPGGEFAEGSGEVVPGATVQPTV